MRQFEEFELRFDGKRLDAGYADVDLTVTFVCDNETSEVKGFYDGDGVYRVRFLPQKSGVYTWKASGSMQAEGREVCEAADAVAHGLVKAVGTHFSYEDGRPYIPFGTTVYALASQQDALVDQTIRTLETAPFNKLRTCVFPKDYEYNHNEPPCYPFERKPDGSWDVATPNIAFWQRLEGILDRIGALGIQVDLILFHPYDRWGFSSLSQEENKRYLAYLLRRLAAKPYLWWSLANEYDLCGRKSIEDWEEIECFVADNDPYGHLLSNHNCFAFWDHSRENITHVSLQTKALTEIPRWIHTYRKPVIIDECCYEGDLPIYWGSISAREMVYRFWRCYASGAFCTHGETYEADDEVIWWAKGGTLKGESPERIAFLREVIESLPGALEPSSSDRQVWSESSTEELYALAAGLPEVQRVTVKSIAAMDERDRNMHLAAEHVWEAHCGEDGYLWFLDQRCYSKKILPLPPDKRYRIELIDVWAATRTVIREGVGGVCEVELPRREGIAILATRMSDVEH